MLHVASPSWAADLRVALVRMPQTGTEPSMTANTYGRIRAELLAGGLSVVTLVEADATSEPTLESAAVRVRSIAAISVAVTGASQPEAYVWLTPGPDRKGELVQVQVAASGEEGDRLLALRVADLLFASLVELEPLRRKRESGGVMELEPPPPPPKPSPEEASPHAQEVRQKTPPPEKPKRPPAKKDTSTAIPHRIADVALGGSAFVSFSGLPLTFAPTATGGWWVGRMWRLGGILSLPAAGDVTDNLVGTADFDQELVAAVYPFTRWLGWARIGSPRGESRSMRKAGARS